MLNTLNINPISIPLSLRLSLLRLVEQLRTLINSPLNKGITDRMGMPKSSSDGRLCKIVFFCFAALLAIILATGFAWTVLLDAELSPEFPEFRVDSVAVSPCPLTAASGSEYLTATWDFTLVAINPNRKLDFYYENLQADIFYGDVDDKESQINSKLGTAPLPPIYVSKMSQTTFDFSVALARSYVGTHAANDLIISSSPSSASSSCYGSGSLWLKLLGFFRYNCTLFGVDGSRLSRFSCDLFPPNGTARQSRACQGFGLNHRCYC